MVKSTYQVSIENNDIDISRDIETILEQYLTNGQDKVNAEIMRTD